MSLFLNQHQSSIWASTHDQTPLRDVAFSVAEAALESDPSSPSFNKAMSNLMDSSPLASDDGLWGDADMDTWPRAKFRASSFAGRGQPLWQVVEHAKERRERVQAADMYGPSHEITLTTHSADPSPVETAFFNMNTMGKNLPRLSARDFAAKAEKDATVIAHARTQSDAEQSPKRVTSRRSRLPSLAQIQAKMNRGTEPTQVRSDSWDSVDSDGPQTPTDETVSFNLSFVRPMTPDSPQSRLAPFLRERTNGRLARPKSMPPLSDWPAVVERPMMQSPRQFSLPTTPPTHQRTTRQMSLPATPGTPSRSWSRGNGIPLLVTPPRIIEHSPMSPTESVTSTASHASSSTLPIITCTPAVEEDSDEESEADVIVFSGELDSDDEDDRRALGREMRDRLLQRQA